MAYGGRMQIGGNLAQALVTSMAVGVVVFDPDLRVIDANPRWCELVGRPREDVIGRTPPYPWQPPANADEYLRRPDGTPVPVLSTRSAVPGRDGRPRAYVATYTDVSARQRSGDVM